MWLKYRPRYRYVNKKSQSRRIRGKAVVISNHNSVYDFALMLMTFPCRDLRYLMAEVLFKKKRLAWFLKNMGGIVVDRDAKDMSFLKTAADLLAKGRVVGSFPEARLHRPEEDKDILLPFVPSTALLALKADAPIIPVYISHNNKGFYKYNIIIGGKLRLSEFCDYNDVDADKLKELSAMLRDKVIELGKNQKAKG